MFELEITFVDAPNETFEACPYFQWKINDGSYESVSIPSGSRISQLKTLAIIRLDLHAAVFGVKL